MACSARLEFAVRKLRCLRVLPAAAIPLAILALLVGSAPASADPLFAAPFLSFDTGSRPFSVAIGDLNGDGKPDLAVANSISSTVSVLLGTGSVVAIEVSLATASAEPGLVRLEWYASTSGFAATVYRRTESETWIALAQVNADGAGHVRFEDRAVEAGHRYGYRLGIQEGWSKHFEAETWVEIPTGVRFALEGLRPNPAAGALVVALSLPSAAPARLEMPDVSGR